MHAFTLTLALLLSHGQIEPDRRIESARLRKNQLAAFSTFTAVNLNGQYDHRIQFLIQDTLKPYGVKWGSPSPTVPVLWLEFSTREDPMLAKDQVLASLRVELRTELKPSQPNEPLHMIRQPFGVAGWTFVAASKEAAHERVSKEIESLMQRFGELWQSSRKPGKR